jgi:hypothetical protein
MLWPVSIGSWHILIGALVLAFAAIALGRRIGLRGITLGLLAVGLILIAGAAGGITWQRHEGGTVAVMVDLSPSTRGAAYRDPAWLRRRAEQLLGRARHRLILFSDRNEAQNAWPARPLGDIPCDQTTFTPPPQADAVLVFSDGRFTLPAGAPPTYIVPDPALEQAASRDSAVTDLRIEGSQALATVRGPGTMDDDKWEEEGSDGGTEEQEESHRHLAARSVRRFVASAPVGRVTARLSQTDLWPENNELSIIPPTPWAAQRWWVGADAPPGWRVMPPDQLPIDASDWLHPGVIVLNGVPAAALSSIQQDRLEQYVRDLGGGLIIAGADHAFAPGDYAGTALERLSPLSSDPPRPRRRWIILLDASGSMNQSTQGPSRWRWAAGALQSALAVVPAADRVDVGGFSDRPRWWSRDRSAKETRAMQLPPTNAHPRGPTNLQQSLTEIVDSPGVTNPSPGELLVLTDTEARLANIPELINQMRQRRMRLWVLATGQGDAFAALKQSAAQTGGAVLEESQLEQWSPALRRLANQARGATARHDPVRIRFDGALAGVRGREVAAWQEMWLKRDATGLGFGPDRPDGLQSGILAASWHVGSGQVAAAAFTPAAAEARAMAQLVAARPSDPRIKATWTTGRTIRVHIDARDEKNYLNNLNLALQIDGATHAVPQSAPGQYDAEFSAPRDATIATLLQNNRPVDRIALPGRYPAEFDMVGNDHAAMTRLAEMTGGKVIDARRNDPIDFHWPRRTVSLDPWLGFLGALFIAGGLVWWRKS